VAVASELMSCSFCGKTQDTVSKLIAGPAVFICNECVGLCVEILDEELNLGEVIDKIVKNRAASSEPPQIKDPDSLSDDDLLAEVVRIHRSHENVDRTVSEVVQKLRTRGLSWSRIGESLGMTKQSAWERFSGED
jgi:hypothetical protein